MSMPVTFSSLLDSPPIETRAAGWLIRRPILIPLAVVLTLLTCWASLAPIKGAVIASARIKVELERKTVQHREGGIVREIRVRNGQKVRAGDVLVVVDDVRSDAELSLLEDQLLAELKTRGVTVVLVGHRRRVMSQLDKLAVLRNGALEAIGPTATILARLRDGAKVLPFPTAEPLQAQA